MIMKGKFQFSTRALYSIRSAADYSRLSISPQFLVENVHTKGELKMTGNCLKASRPLLSFDKTFDSHPHLVLIKELFIQVRIRQIALTVGVSYLTR